MRSVEIAPGIHWTGALDPHLRTLHLMTSVPRGTSYNSYLVQGDQASAVIDSVRDYAWEEQEARLRELASPAQITHIVINHAEPDHSGSLLRLMEMCPLAEILATQRGIGLLKSLVNRGFRYREIQEGDQLDLGDKTLRFIPAPFWHWPDSMFTYVVEDRVLFSCDGFSTHQAGPGMFDDQAGNFLEGFEEYYRLVMSPYRPFIARGLDRLTGVNPLIIAPGHGPILRTNASRYIELYREWSSVPEGEPGRVLVAYASAHGYTEELAGIVASSLLAQGLRPAMVNIGEEEPRCLSSEVSKAAALLVGSPTFNRDAPEPVWRFLAAISAVSNRGKPAAAFGSYGWSGEAVSHIEERLKQLGFKVLAPGLKAVLKPSEEEQDEALGFGREFASFMREGAASPSDSGESS